MSWRRKTPQKRNGKEEDFLNTYRDIVITGSAELLLSEGAEKMTSDHFPELKSLATKYIETYCASLQSCVGTCIPVQVSESQCVFILINRTYEKETYQTNAGLLAYLTAAIKDLYNVLYLSGIKHRKLCIPRIGAGPQRIPWRYTYHMIDTYILMNKIDCEMFDLNYKQRDRNHMHFP